MAKPQHRQRFTALSNKVMPLLLDEEFKHSVAADKKISRKRVENYYKEWIGEMADKNRQDDYFLAKSAPRDYFVRWVESRIADPFFVIKSIRDIVNRQVNVDFANKLLMIVWPQEIAWAQKYRLDANPFSATKAALFLAQAQDDTKTAFLSLSALYASALETLSYSESEFHDMSADEIRNCDSIPDFTPLFLQHANKHYGDRLSKLKPQDFEKYAQVAAQVEHNERQSVMRNRLVDHAQSFPMRYNLPVIAAARNHGISSNELYLLEQYFVDQMKKQHIDILPGSSTAHPAFVTFLSDKKSMKRNLLEAGTFFGPDARPVDQWDIVNLNRYWFDQLPAGFKSVGSAVSRFNDWKDVLVVGERKLPFDPISDLGFFLLEKSELSA